MKYPKTLLICLGILSAYTVFGQPTGGGPAAPTPLGFEEVLIVGAMAAGIRKIKNSKHNLKETKND